MREATKIFKNSYYDTKNSRMHLWEQINGKDLYATYDWSPYVFLKNTKGHIRTIDGQSVHKKSFQTYQDYYNFSKDNSNILENSIKPEIQFLSERYYNISDDELNVPNLLIYTIDIEVVRKKGFPNVNEAIDPINLISIKNSKTNKITTFGKKEYTGKKKITYIHCEKEKILLIKFFDFMYKNPPDVITGWNISNFDLPYIINRTKNLFGKDEIYRSLSPIKIVRTWQSKKYDEINIDIAGICILDYYQIYKWYSPNKLESYTLDYVSKYELEKGKLDYSEYKDLHDLYKNNWNLFVDYNVVDCDRVDSLEKKMGYIKLIQSLSLLTKCPMKFYNSMTQLIEGAMLTYFRRNNLCAPYFAGGTQEGFEAAYVKNPMKGMHEWVSSLDIRSSYPFHIITLNMSNETFIGCINSLTEDEIIYNTKNRSFPKFTMIKNDVGVVEFNDKKLKSFNMALDRGLITIAPCGSVFSTTEPGVLAIVEREIYFKRKEVKGKMFEVKKNDPDNPKVGQLFALQLSIKILLNAMFGITAVPYSRYFNTYIAEAITSCGRHTLKQGEKFVNSLLNDPTKKLKEIFKKIENE